jgi:hypothetical protein
VLEEPRRISECANERWNQIHADQKEKKDLYPVLWRMFKPSSHLKIMSSFTEFFLSPEPKLENVEIMEFCPFFGNVSQCLVFTMLVPVPAPFERLPTVFITVLKRTDTNETRLH